MSSRTVSSGVRAAAALAAALAVGAACTDGPAAPATPAVPVPRPAIGFRPVMSVSVIDLGTLGTGYDGTAESRAYGINDAGTVVGYEITPAGTFPFHWSPGAGLTHLGPAGEQGAAYGINADGYIVGNAGSRPAFWQPDGTRVFLPRLAGAAAVPCSHTQCSAQAVNGTLEIAGFDRTAAGETHAVVWRVSYTWRLYIKLYPFEPLPPPIRLGERALLPVAVLGQPGLDVREIDPRVLRFGDDDGIDTPVARDPHTGQPLVSYEDVDRDGDIDLLLHFAQAELEERGDLTAETVALHLTGDVGDGTGVQGSVKVEVVAR